MRLIGEGEGGGGGEGEGEGKGGVRGGFREVNNKMPSLPPLVTSTTKAHPC